MTLSNPRTTRRPAALTAARLDARALKSLKALGYTNAAERLRAMRTHLASAALRPAETVTQLMQTHRFVGLGEMHDFAGRYLLADLVAAAAAGGAQWLFVEVYSSSQAAIDAFVSCGDHRQLPESAGGGMEAPMRFQQPYIDMLQAARAAGLRIVAIDADNADHDQRNRVMASAVERCLQEPGSRGVAVVGQLHLIPRSILGFGDSMATLLRESLGADEVVTVGRGVPDAAAEFSVWSDVAAVIEPALLPVLGSPFVNLAATHWHETLVACDFDYLLFYAAHEVLP